MPCCSTNAVTHLWYPCTITLRVGRSRVLYLLYGVGILCADVDMFSGVRQGGRQGDLLLREDQLLSGVWKQRLAKKDTMTTMFADCNSADLMAPRSTVGADVVVGFGRRNPNAMKGRERRGKKKPSGR